MIDHCSFCGNAAVAQFLERHEGTTLVNDCAPAWQYSVAMAYAHSPIFASSLQLDFSTVFDTVAVDGELRNAVTAEVRLGSQGSDALPMITDWQKRDGAKIEDHD